MRERQTILLILGLILLVGFELRVNYLLHISPVGDEYITMLAVDSTVQRGYPRLPSGLYYDHGLLFSYIDSFLAWLFGLDQFVARLPSLMVGMLTIATIYKMGSRWFSRRAGAIAASVIALSPQAITWGARARMYGLWSWLFLLATFYLASGVIVQDARLSRCLGIAALIGAAFSHILTVALTVPLILGLLFGKMMIRRKQASSGGFEKPLWPEAILLTVGALLLASFRRWQGQWGVVGRVIGDSQFLRAPLPLVVRVSGAAAPFTSPPQGFLGLPVIAGTLFLSLRMIRRCARQEDPILVYLIILLTGGVIGVGSLGRLHADRYVFALLSPFALLVGRELDFVGELISRRTSSVLELTLPLILVAAVLTPTAWRTVTHDEINLDRAYAFVRHHRQSGDRIGTTIPAAAYISLGQCNYYVLEGGKTFRNAGQRVDIWTSTPYCGSAEAFASVLSSEHRTWLVIDSWSWDRYYSTGFRKLIEDEMELVLQLPGVRVYLHDG
jgi:4-amino-4-deoxy-L-arabinose transferase-like glycosyltransferase